MSQALDAISDGGNQAGKGQNLANNEIFNQLYDAPPKQGDVSLVSGTSRVLSVASGGILDAGKSALANPMEYADDALMGLGIGTGLGAISKAGKFGPHAAAIIGGGMMASWAYSEIKGDRWNGFGSAMADSFRSGENLEANRKIAAASLGTFAVEFGVMSATGGAGAALGRKVAPQGWGSKAFETVKASSLSLASSMKPEASLLSKSLPITAETRAAASHPSVMEKAPWERGNAIRELVEGRSFASSKAGEGKPVDVMSDAATLIKEKKGFTDLKDISAAMLEGQIKRDGVALGIKTEIQTILTENQGLSAKKQGLTHEITQLEAQRTNVANAKVEQMAVEAAERSVREIQAGREKLVTLEAQKTALDAQVNPKKDGGGKEQRGKKGEAKEGEPSAAREELGKVKQEIRELKESTSDQALIRARARVHDAQQALQAKKDGAPAEVEAITTTIEGKKTELGQLEQRGQELVTSMTDAMTRYNQRLEAIRKDSGLIQPASVEQVASAKVQQRQQTRNDGGGDKGSTSGGANRNTDVGGSRAKQVVDRSADQPARVVEKVDPNSPKGKADAADVAFQRAKQFSDKFTWEKTQAKALAEKAEIESGKRKFPDEKAKTDALEAAENAIAKSKLELGGEQAKYAQTLKRINEYAKSIEQAYIADKDFPITESVAKLERLMEPIDHIWSPPPGRTGELARPGRSGKTAEMRLPDIQKHLEAKIEHVDGNQFKRIGPIKDNPTIKSIMEAYEKGELPEGGSIVLTKKNGSILMQSELQGRPQQRGPQGADAAQRARHAETTPVFIDIGRLENGIGPDGAGLFRLIGLEKEISGAVILQPVMKDGQPQFLRGNGKGKPMIKKEVAMTIGEAPEAAQPGVIYGDLLNMMRPKQGKPAGQGRSQATEIATKPVEVQDLAHRPQDPALLEQIRNASSGEIKKGPADSGASAKGALGPDGQPLKPADLIKKPGDQ